MKPKLIPVPHSVIQPDLEQYRRFKREQKNRPFPKVSKEEWEVILEEVQKVRSLKSKVGES